MATPEAKELSLVGKVELRIALADSDVKLETTLNTYLAPLLLKLASEHLSVRNKVISICQHINNRIKPQSIKLPVAALLKQFKEHPSTPLIRHFDLLYVQQGIGRLPIPERLELLPALIRGLESDTANSALHGSQLFHLLLRLLALFKLPARGSKEDEELRAKLNVSDVDAKFVSFWLGKLILLNIVRAPNPSSGVTCPGLSANEYHFLALQGNTDAWDPAKDNGLNLAETKVTAARFLASGVFTDAERFLPAVFASADSNSRISEVGDDMLKRALPNTDLENRTIITQLYSVYFGDPGGSLAARPALRIKLVSLFAKSLSSTTFPNQVIRIVEEALVSGEEDVGGTREISKLRSAIFAFINFVARHASPNDQHAIAPKVVYRLKDFIEVQGWPEGIGGDPTLRGYAYEVIGLLSKAGPTELLLEPNLDLLRWLFQSLREDTSGKNVTVSVEEALSSVLGAFTGSLDGTVEQSLKALLISQMLPGNGRSTSYVAVRFANRCLPYDALEARWIDLLAIGAAEGPEVIEEGRRGLDPYWYQMTSGYKHSTGFADSRVRFPKFVDFVDYVFIDHDPADATGLEGLEMASVSEAVHCLRMQYPKVFTPAVQHCRQLLMNEALDKHCIMLEINADWARKLDRTMSSDETARRAAGGFVRTMLSDPPKKKALSILLYALFQDLVVTGSVGHSDGGEHFVELCALCPDDLIAGVAPRFRSLESAITSNTYTTRAIAAHAYGLLASNPACSSEDVLQSAQLLLKKVGSWDRAVGSEVNQAHGALIALSFFFSRLAHRRRIEPDLQNVFQQCLTNVFSILTTAKDNLLKEASCTAIGQLSLYSALSVSDIPSNLSYDTVADKIYDVAKSGNEKAILALGHLAMTPKESEEDAEFSELYHIEALLHKLHEIRQTEAHFAVGEALSCLACGWDSKALATKFDIEGSHPFGPKRERTLPRIMDRTLNDCRDTKPALKKVGLTSSCVCCKHANWATL
ncbi:hypothetical protein LTR04_003240 [Oleoguttula sp. CCFEE 6159]|nr:hypothetical protein LTR04_003240 [Oleoguttula sp. CCFEE 6159]